MKDLSGFNNIIMGITLECLYQRGREELGFPDTDKQRRNFLDEMTKNLAVDFFSNIDKLINEGVISNKELENLKQTLPPDLAKTLEDIMAGKGLGSNSFEYGNIPLKDELEGLKSLKSKNSKRRATISSSDYQEQEEEKGNVLVDKTEGMSGLPSGSLFKDEDFLN